jgi:hypothetical protein
MMATSQAEEWMLEAARETTQESMIFIISLLGV